MFNVDKEIVQTILKAIAVHELNSGLDFADSNKKPNLNKHKLSLIGIIF